MSEPREIYYLTSEEIQWQDEIAADRSAAELTLKIALAHHENRISTLEKERQKFWDQMSRLMGYETLQVAPILEITSKYNQVCIIVKEDGEDDLDT